MQASKNLFFYYVKHLQPIWRTTVSMFAFSSGYFGMRAGKHTFHKRKRLYNVLFVERWFESLREEDTFQQK